MGNSLTVFLEEQIILSLMELYWGTSVNSNEVFMVASFMYFKL